MGQLSMDILLLFIFHTIHAMRTEEANSSHGDICAICLEILKPDQQTLAPCGNPQHTCHEVCLRKWKSGTMCPICRGGDSSIQEQSHDSMQPLLQIINYYSNYFDRRMMALLVFHVMRSIAVLGYTWNVMDLSTNNLIAINFINWLFGALGLLFVCKFDADADLNLTALLILNPCISSIIDI